MDDFFFLFWPDNIPLYDYPKDGRTSDLTTFTFFTDLHSAKEPDLY